VTAPPAPPAHRGARRGASYIATPQWLVNKKCVVNVRNEDTRCLLYALASALHADVICGHRERPTLYAPFLDELKRDGVRFPASVDDAASISEMNALPLHVFGLDITDPDRNFTIEHHNRVFTSRPPIALLRLHEGSRVGHFVWIRRFNAFVRFSRASLHCCAVCLQRFKRETALRNHSAKGACISAGEKVKVLPTLEKSTVRFAGFTRQLRAPFVVYADLECLLLPASEARGPQTTATQTHVPCCVGAYLVSRYPDIIASQYVSFSGVEDSIEPFFAWLFAIEATAIDAITNFVPLSLSAEDAARAETQTDCHICTKALGGDRVLDHDHLSGAFRGVAHKACNLNYGYRHYKLPVFFHNLAGYDAHFLLQRAGAFRRRMTCLAKTAERLVSFTIGACVFKDSLQFMGKSLATCVESLGSANFRVHDAEFAGECDELRALLRQKGVMPYDWMDGAEKLAATALPPIADFASKLTGAECSEEDYARAQRVWTLARCATMRDYLMLYLKTDVVLLADVFESFRDVGFDHYKLDPTHYYTLPGYSLDACLKFTGAAIGCLHDSLPHAHEMLDMLQRGVRGGVSVVSTRHAVANNPLLPGYDATQPNSFIMNWDANNLYGGAMCEALPVGDYSLEHVGALEDERAAEHGQDDAIPGAGAEAAAGIDADTGGSWDDADSDSDCDSDDALSRGWSEGEPDEDAACVLPLPPASVQRRSTAACLANVLALEPNGERGCFVEVDLVIPPEAHDALNEYPPAPEHTLFEPSPLMAGLHAELGLSSARVPKLIPNLCDKKKYVVHFRALQKYVEQGCVVTRIHKILWFRQERVLAPYIQYNTERRKAAKTALEKDMLKLMNNAVFGKTCENVENRMNVVLATDADTIMRHASKPTFVDMQLIGNGLVALHMRATSVLYNKPLAIGVAVLDISKTFMYDFHYDYVMKKYGNRAKLLFTDTDSLTYAVQTPDIYEDMLADLSRFDTSDYPVGHKCFSAVNKKVVLKMKDESNGAPIRAFAGLRAKMYCFLSAEERAEPTAKGIARSEIARLTWGQYEAALFGTTLDEKQQSVTSSSFRSSDHRVATLRMTKTGLCAYDDKRYVLPDNVHTLAHGHWRIEGLREAAAATSAEAQSEEHEAVSDETPETPEGIDEMTDGMDETA